MPEKPKGKPTVETTEFVPLPEFEEVARRIFSNSKEDSDRQLAEFQLSNEHHRSVAARKKNVTKKKPE